MEFQWMYSNHIYTNRNHVFKMANLLGLNELMRCGVLWSGSFSSPWDVCNECNIFIFQCKSPYISSFKSQFHFSPTVTPPKGPLKSISIFLLDSLTVSLALHSPNDKPAVKAVQAFVSGLWKKVEISTGYKSHNVSWLRLSQPIFRTTNHNSNLYLE